MLARDRKLVTELDAVRAEAAKLKTFLFSSTVRVSCLEGVITRLKAANTEEVRNATFRIAAGRFIPVDCLERKVAILKQVSKETQADIRRLTDTHTRDWKKTLASTSSS